MCTECAVEGRRKIGTAKITMSNAFTLSLACFRSVRSVRLVNFGSWKGLNP